MPDVAFSVALDRVRTVQSKIFFIFCSENKVIKYLIKTVEIEIDVIGDRRLTPLHLACEKGYLDVAKCLIDNGASTTLRNAQLYNCLEISIKGKHKKIVEYLLGLPNWREMMRNAQPIEDTDAYDTPMRKLIRYMPDMALWMVETKLTRKFGGGGQKVSKEIYDYEFYEDMQTVKQWHAQGMSERESRLMRIALIIGSVKVFGSNHLQFSTSDHTNPGFNSAELHTIIISKI
jgi:hypothetical protein